MAHPQPNYATEAAGLRRSGQGLFAVLAAVSVALACTSGLLIIGPARWPLPPWAYLLTGTLGFGSVLATWRWPESTVAPLATLLLDLLAIGLFWVDPASPVGPVLLLLLSAVSAVRFRKRFLNAHLAGLGIALVGAHWVGAGPASLLLLASALTGVVAITRVLYLRFRDQAIQTDHLRRLMQLLPVLKAHGVEDVVEAAVRHIVKATGSRKGIVLLLDGDARVLRPHYMHSEADMSPAERQALLSTTVEVGVGLSGWVAQHGQSIFTNDAAEDPRSVQVPGTPREDESILVVPLITNGRLYGVLRVDRLGVNQYDLNDLHLLELMAAHVSDAISRAQLEERLARRDALTGVYNRHFLNEWSQRVGSEPREVSVLMIDCRGFKQINDRWGHLTGDWVLQECADLISGSVRGRDLVVRYGGDEFLVVLANTSHQEALAIAARLQERVAEWNAGRGDDEPHLVLDIGVDTAPQSQWQQLLDRADERMYACKHG